MKQDRSQLRIAVLEERQRGDQRAMKMLSRAGGRALDIQSKEIKRRLEELNHAHAQMAARDTEYVRAQTFNISDKEWRATTEKQALDLVKIGSDLNSLTARFVGLSASITWLSRVVTAAVVTGLVTLAVEVLRSAPLGALR